MGEWSDKLPADERWERLLARFREVHLDSFSSQRDEVLGQRRTFRVGFEQRLRDRWGGALDEYEVIVEAALMMWWQFNKRWFLPARAAGDQKTICLIDLDARCLRVAQEVFALLRSGFAFGAHARARTMHELAVVAFFIRDNPPQVAQRYREHAVVDRYKRAVEYNRTLPQTHAHLGYESIEEETLRGLAQRRARLREQYGADFLNVPHGWAAAALGKRRPTLRDLEESVGMTHHRPFYAWSSQDVHPGSHGNELSYLARGSGAQVLNAGPSNGGLADPAQGALISLHQTTTALCTPLAERESPEDSCPVMEVQAYRVAEVRALGELVDKAQRTFLEVDRKLEEDERRA